jgi:hypothetical protein
VLFTAFLVQPNPQPPVLRIYVLHFHADRRADAREGIDHEADEGAVAYASRQNVEM